MCFWLSEVTVMENKNAHIQPLCFGELLLFPSMGQFEYEGKNKKGKHMSLSFCKLQWGLVHASESTFVFSSSFPLFLCLPWLSIFVI